MQSLLFIIAKELQKKLLQERVPGMMDKMTTILLITVATALYQ